MAGKRVYITIPRRDYELIRRLGLLTEEGPGMVCRRWVLLALYDALMRDAYLQDYDAQLAAEERREATYGRRS